TLFPYTTLFRSKSQSNGTGKRDHFWRRIFVGEFRGDVFARRKAESSVCNVYGLLLQTDEMHLDAAGLLIVNGAMPPAPKIKIRSELPIGARQQVQIKLRRHFRIVVIGAFEDCF